MALPNTGAISIGDIGAEFGGAAAECCLSEYYGAGAGIPDSGEISVSDFYGASAATFIKATGGSVSTSGNYKFHTYTSSSNFNVSQTATGSASNVINLCLVGSGGPGGDPYGSWPGGGGGAGGMVVVNDQAVLGELSVIVGNSEWGGNHQAKAGNVGGCDSGVSNRVCGSAGGKAGRYGQNAGQWTAGQGHDGGASAEGPGYFHSGGGGGAGSTGGTTGGGSGRTWSQNGATYSRGGNGNTNTGGAGSNGTFYGNGGGGRGPESNVRGNGYQGIVICRYQYQ